MKRILLLFSLFSSLALTDKIHAQCTITNVSITPKSVSTIGGCNVTVDLQYSVALNGGSKHTIIHLWESTKYPSPAHVASDYPLATAATGTMIGTIVINYQGVTPQILSAWPTGPNEFKNNTIPSTPILVPGGFSSSTVGSNTVVNFTNLVLPISNCNTAISITGDVWATQNDQSASCLAAGAIAVVANDPIMNGLLNCTSPSRTFNVSFKTLLNSSITFSAYRDANGNGVFDAVDQSAGKLTLSGGSISTPTTDVTINTTANTLYPLGSIMYSPQPAGDLASVFIVARKSGNNYDNVLRLQNSCSPLPVSFKSFSAIRNNQSVSLKWETASEQNDKGFYVQRNVNGEWKNVAFVFSRADGGNSDQVLSYAYNDPNNYSAISYYRLLQVDLDGNGKYSEIRTVKGQEQSSKLMLFPNPGTNGKINVMFSNETSTKEVIVYDANGRIVKSYKNVVGDNLMIDQLKPGVYNVQVKNNNTQIVSSEKFIIQN
jgi:hypothetical protein